jgi:hypothetical protein
MNAKAPYLILVQCEDEPCSLERFTTLGAASAYIQEYWQGMDYIESPHRFSTDYAGYVLVNFSLETIGKFVKEPGKNWEYYVFDPVSEQGTEEARRIIYDAPRRLKAVRECYSEGKERRMALLKAKFMEWDPDAKSRCRKCGSDDLEMISGDSRCGTERCRRCGYEVTWID